MGVMRRKNGEKTAVAYPNLKSTYVSHINYFIIGRELFFNQGIKHMKKDTTTNLVALVSVKYTLFLLV